MDDLILAQDLFRQGNLPQADIYVWRCLARDGSNFGAAKLLNDLRRAYGFSESFELSERVSLISSSGDRYLLIKAWGCGFWSEVHHLVTQLLLAELTQRTPIILWGRNCLFRNDSDINAFGHFFQEISSARIDDIRKPTTIFPSKWSLDNIYDENVNKWEGEDSRMAAQFLFDRSEILLVSDFYSTLSSIIPWIDRSSKYYGLSEDILYSELFQKYLKPTLDIADKVDDFYVQNMQRRPWVAIHIRGSDKIHESPNLAKIKAHCLVFIDRIVELNPTIGIFLLTDSSTVMEELIQHYGERILCTKATRVAGNVGVHLSGHDGIVIGKEVLVDTLLAIKCDYFIGNKESCVSFAISSMRYWPQGFMFLLGGEGSGRGENLFLHNRNSCVI